MTSTKRQGSISGAEAGLADLGPEQRIAQCLLVMPGVDDRGRPDAATLAAVRAGVGTLHSVVGMPASHASEYYDEIREVALDAGVLPPLISGNLESGIGYSLGRTGTDLPYPRGLGIADDEELAYRAALLAAREARAVGYHWTFSPCVDVLTTSEDPILGVRAFGVGTDRTAALAAAQIRGFRDGGVASTAKHFPGHGDSSVDSHLGLPVIDRTAEAHSRVHLPPFAAAVASGVPSIMVGHVVLPGHGVDVPASLSPVVNRDWLRGGLGYDGVIITDSLRMSAVSARWSAAESAVLALSAGADVANAKCAAEELPGLVAAVHAALTDGVLDPRELDASVLRLLRMRDEIAVDEAPEPAVALDSPREWLDSGRAVTVEQAGQVSIGGRDIVFVGASPLAERLAAAARRRGAPARHEPPNADTAVSPAPGTLVAAVVVPDTAVGPEDRRRIDQLARYAELLVVNGVMPAESLRRDRACVIVAPAVDAFGIVTEAAVDAVLDRLDPQVGD
ncbi:glycoside hydrolase family 3 N-terminal domain-containing protein [Myceligenerans pegani]|uniref:beta-N-acetylhexosaminidase n=1 Tax=Myceligenerans pegani TaxID=2776917 RepID=A0ABR9N0P5_9MICO|nr:glycoside hydrolase family 3 N-terminal domain-containing protein [Myceligenerans sp. TRM 65318]MBE1876577.1 hypothetical protein [Myceligenerans sp. TRM 65318]MBE3018848.1 hypothetical protein [Myceligenerans sp. TRM 65318]